MISLNKYERYAFQVKTQRNCMGMFNCVSEGNRLFQWHFHFLLPVMLDKAAFMSAALLCVQLLPYYFWCSKSATYWQRMNLHFK